MDKAGGWKLPTRNVKVPAVPKEIYTVFIKLELDNNQLSELKTAFKNWNTDDQAYKRIVGFGLAVLTQFEASKD